jgi:DNA-binding Xre family transcriptional regulator
MLPMSEILSIKWSTQRGSRLRQMRGEIALADLARKLNDEGIVISRQYLHRLETDEEVKGVSTEIIEGLSIVLGVTVTDLLCLDSRLVVLSWVDKSS